MDTDGRSCWVEEVIKRGGAESAEGRAEEDWVLGGAKPSAKEVGRV